MKYAVFLAMFLLITLPYPVSAYGLYSQDELNTTNTEQNITFVAGGNSEIVYITVPRSANITNAELMFTGYESLSNYYISQSTANETSFSAVSTWTVANPSANFVNDNWNTYAATENCKSSFIFVNYTKYTDSTSESLWHLKTGEWNANFSIPSYCWDGRDSVNFTIYGYTGCPAGASRIRLSCLNLSDDVVIFNDSGNTLNGFMKFYEDEMYWAFAGYSENITTDTGDDGENDYINTTIFNTSETIDLNITAINNYLHDTCTADWVDGTCDVPFNVSSVAAGILEISGINLSGYYLDPVGSCGGYYVTALNFSFMNETSLTAITASAGYTITMLDESGQEYNASTGNVGSFVVCILNGTYEADMIVKYEKAGMGTRFYFLDNASVIGSSANNIMLYLLDTALGDSVDVTVQNAFGYPIDGAYVQFQRYYIGENTYRVVAMLKTDDSGVADAFLNTDNIWYKYVITKDGEVLRVIGPSLITSTVIVLSTSTGAGLTWKDYSTGISCSCTYSDATKCLICTVADPSGLANEICLDVDEFNVMNISDYDLQCGTGASMTLISNLSSVDSYNGTVKYMLYVVSPYVPLEEDSIQFGTVIAYGIFGVLLTAIIFMIAAGMGVWNPAAGIIMGVVGIVAAVALGLFSVPMLALGSLIFVAAIIVYKVKT